VSSAVSFGITAFLFLVALVLGIIAIFNIPHRFEFLLASVLVSTTTLLLLALGLF
jgi:hypothetical protein